MSEIEKIKRYIEREKLSASVKYDMNMSECMALSKQVYEGMMGQIEVIALAFDYGRAKGYRAGKEKVQCG